ncbi:MAG: hypothetical protein IT376_13875 [Polyangiaceae bacterium]|nr:hypothetical protein [Polyangiaceae bacterium]
MRVRAVAVASERSRAIGGVELECTPAGLRIAYAGLGTFQPGYAPAALTAGTEILARWDQIRVARIEGEELFLELDPEATPHHALLLAGFSSGDVLHPRELARQRWVVRLGAVAAAIVASVLTTVGAPRLAPGVTSLGALGFAILAAGGILAVGLVADRALLPATDPVVREAFAAELALRLPRVDRGPRPARRPTDAPAPLVALEGALPRTVLAAVITLSAAALGVVLSARRPPPERADPEEGIAAADRAARPEALPAQPPAPAALPADPAGHAEPSVRVAAPPASPAPSARASAGDAVAGEPCACARPSSLVFPDPLPRLAVLVLERKALRVEGVRPRLTVEVAAVNDSSSELEDVTIRVHFFEPDPAAPRGERARRYRTRTRALYFAGPLAPGQAVKWRTEARGSEIEIESGVEGAIEAPTDAAPADAIAGLLEANHRPVRLHAAMLLAWLADPRARPAALRLAEAMRDDEAPYLRRVVEATAPVRVCALEASGARERREVTACVHNLGPEPASDLGLRVRGLGGRVSADEPTAAPPAWIAEATLRLPAPLAPGVGVIVRGELPCPDGDPVQLEATADRIDRLDREAR